MKKILSIVSITVLSHFSLANDQGLATAKELMSVMKIKEGVEKSLDQVSEFTDSMIDAQNLTPEVKQKAKELSNASTEVTFKEMLAIDWETMFSEVYAEVFTEQELQGLIDFYQTPVGVKFLDKQLDLQKATMGRMQVEMAKIMPKIQQAMQQAMQQSIAEAQQAK